MRLSHGLSIFALVAALRDNRFGTSAPEWAGQQHHHLRGYVPVCA